MRSIDAVFLHMININLSFRNIEKDIELDNFFMFIHAYAYFCALLKCQKTKKILA